MNLYDVFHETAHRQPTRPAVLGPGPADALSYSQLDHAIRTTGERLARSGVCAGHCVGLHCPSGADYIVLTYALWQCGCCAVPIPTELAAGEKQDVCREIALDFVISRAKTASFAAPFGTGPLSEVAPGI